MVRPNAACLPPLLVQFVLDFDQWRFHRLRRWFCVGIVRFKAFDRTRKWVRTMALNDVPLSSMAVVHGFVDHIIENPCRVIGPKPIT